MKKHSLALLLQLAGVTAVAFAACPAAAAVQLELGARVGYSVPFGSTYTAIQSGGVSLKLKDTVAGQVPMRLDLGVRILNYIGVGIYGQIDPSRVGGITQSVCDVLDATCAAFGFRGGVQAMVHILPKKEIDPWGGVGAGFELLGTSVKDGSNKTSYGYAGYEFPFQAGVDFKVKKWFYLGPYMSYTLGKFRSYAEEICKGNTCTKNDDKSIAETALHSWFTLGVRVGFLVF
jgi:hypothetical protein